MRKKSKYKRTFEITFEELMGQERTFTVRIRSKTIKNAIAIAKKKIHDKYERVFVPYLIPKIIKEV